MCTVCADRPFLSLHTPPVQDSRKNFRFGPTTGLTLAGFHRLETEHRARSRGGFNGEGAMVKRADLVLFARQQVETHNEKLLVSRGRSPRVCIA